MSELPRVFISEPHALIQACAFEACRAAGAEPIVAARVVDSSAYLHDEAQLLDASELADAEAALIEDRIFEKSELPGDETLLRAAIKYGWALAHLLSTDVGEHPLLWSVSDGATTTTPLELSFLLEELRRRQIPITCLAPCWPVALEPLRDLDEERAPVFRQALEGYAPLVQGADIGLFIRNAAEKISVLPAIATLGARAVIDLTGIAEMEAARIVARAEPELFRRWLGAAQEHFPFDKGRLELSTTEDDVHALPDVPDSDMERVFIEDSRGRQLLHVTSRSCFDDSPLGAELESVWSARRAEWVKLAAERFQQHFAACRPCDLA